MGRPPVIPVEKRTRIVLSILAVEASTSENARNGTRAKTVLTEVGAVAIR